MYSLGNGKYSYQYTPNSTGIHTAFVTCKDSAGNRGSSTTTITVGFDVQAGSLSFSQINSTHVLISLSGVYYGSPTTVSYKITDTTLNTVIKSGNMGPSSQTIYLMFIGEYWSNIASGTHTIEGSFYYLNNIAEINETNNKVYSTYPKP